tara:strand:- start:1084 stop:1440 length:357 start_codon:yes stop_codon:yes gene_type:complete
MALERGKLTDVITLGTGTTAAAVTVASNKKIYVKSIMAHAPYVGLNSGTAQIYMVPNSGGSAGAASTSNQIFDSDVYAGETVLFEPSYPIVIDSTGDTIQVGTGATTINFLITGDKEA